MRKCLTYLQEGAIWFGCALLSVILALSGWGQPILAGLAILPVTMSLQDPYVKTAVSTVLFVGMFWLMTNFLELAVILSLVQVRSMCHAWWRYIRVAMWEEQEGIGYARTGVVA